MSKFPLIVFEGIDGSGKTHHINKIISSLIELGFKVKNIQNDEILTSSGASEDDLGPMREAVRAGKADLTKMVSDEFMRQFNVVSGTPEECVPIIQDLIDAGMNLPIMEVVGENADMNLETIRLLGEEVVPHLKFSGAS